MTPTESDRELAREWVERAWKGPKIASCEDAYLAGLEHGRLTWTGTPPDREEYWWWRASPDHPGRVVHVTRDTVENWTEELRVIFRGWVERTIPAVLEEFPRCQWSSAPIPAPRETT